MPSSPNELGDRALEVRIDPRGGQFVVPCESTIRRTLQACDGDLLDAVLGA